MMIVFHHSFLIVILGVSFLAIASSLVGTISVLTKQSLVGDMIAHASYPGILLAYLVFSNRSVWLLLLGAVITGYLSLYCVHFISKNQTKTNALALVSASFFGLGIVFKQLIQTGRPSAGLDRFLFGQAAYMQVQDVVMVAVVFIVCCCLFFVFYQQIKWFVFDPIFLKLTGGSTTVLQHIMIGMLIVVIAIGLKVVGALLMSSFLIAPCIFGLFYSKSFRQLLIIAIEFSLCTSFLGAMISANVFGMPTGPTIIVIMSLAIILSFLMMEIVRPLIVLKRRD